LFEKPGFHPADLHSALYRSGKAPSECHSSAARELLGDNWSKLDANILGESAGMKYEGNFNRQDRATNSGGGRDGGRYTTSSSRIHEKTHSGYPRTWRAKNTRRLLRQYSEALEKKYSTHEFAPPTELFSLILRRASVVHGLFGKRVRNLGKARHEPLRRLPPKPLNCLWRRSRRAARSRAEEDGRVFSATARTPRQKLFSRRAKTGGGGKRIARTRALALKVWRWPTVQLRGLDQIWR